jgi:hypothetical protein
MTFTKNKNIFGNSRVIDTAVAKIDVFKVKYHREFAAIYSKKI